MTRDGVRTAAIVAGLAAVVAFVPHGGSSAAFVGALITIALTVLLVLFAARIYQMFRTDIYGLGETHRAVLYGSLGALVLAMAGRDKLFDTGAGTLLWIAAVAAAIGGLVSCFARWRADRV